MDKMYDTLYIANNLVGVAVTLLRTLKRKQKSRNVLRRRWSKEGLIATIWSLRPSNRSY